MKIRVSLPGFTLLLGYCIWVPSPQSNIQHSPSACVFERIKVTVFFCVCKDVKSTVSSKYNSATRVKNVKIKLNTIFYTKVSRSKALTQAKYGGGSTPSRGRVAGASSQKGEIDRSHHPDTTDSASTANTSSSR